MRKSFASIYRVCYKQPLFKDLCAPEKKLSVVSSDFEGRSVQQSQYVIDDPKTRYAGLKPSDFSLENQISVGVPQKLVQYSPSLNAIDSELNRVNSLTENDFNHETEK